MTDLSPEDTAAIIATLEETGQYRVLRRLPERTHFNPHDGSEAKLGIILDCETTGLDHTKDEIIELSILPFIFSPQGVIWNSVPPLTRLRQPTLPIPPEITEITGIDDAMVAGQTIDPDEVAAFIDPAALIIAHNAEFDRPFAEKLCDALVKKCWACSMSQINWRGEGLYSTRLASLLTDMGFFYDRHRAESDCRALLELLTHTLPKTGTLALATMLEAARKPTWDIWALASPFPTKDALKARGYRWNPGEDGRPKSWWISGVTEEKRDAETEFLRTKVYRGEEGWHIEAVTAFDRFALRQLRHAP